MAKLNKANTQGSTSVIIPVKTMKELGWKAGEEVVLIVKERKLVIKNIKDVL